MSELVTTIRAGEVSVGDRVRTANALELTVTRVDEGFMGRPNLLALVEDSDSPMAEDRRAARLRAGADLQSVGARGLTEMRYRPLGRSGLLVSVVGLGCNNFGGRIDGVAARAVVDAAIDAGSDAV